eukprot:7675120-Lingulodinium_polyedra.AAC.1
MERRSPTPVAGPGAAEPAGPAERPAKRPRLTAKPAATAGPASKAGGRRGPDAGRRLAELAAEVGRKADA